jgi:hypothetical protein
MAELGINIANWILYKNREEKTEGLRKAENIEIILKNIKNLKY